MYVVVFDIDGTLTPIGSSWHFLHVVLGSRIRSEPYKRAFFRGDISYEEWVYLDLSLWKGVKYELFKDILRSIPWRCGIEELRKLVEVYRGNAKFVAITCGFKELADRCVEELGFDYGIGVEVEVDDRGYLTGRPRRFVSAWSKREELEEYLDSVEGVSKIVSIGDSVVDIPLFEASDVAIAFCPSEIERLAKYSDIVVRSCDIRKLVNELRRVLAR